MRPVLSQRLHGWMASCFSGRVLIIVCAIGKQGRVVRRLSSLDTRHETVPNSNRGLGTLSGTGIENLSRFTEFDLKPLASTFPAYLPHLRANTSPKIIQSDLRSVIEGESYGANMRRRKFPFQRRSLLIIMNGKWPRLFIESTDYRSTLVTWCVKF